MRIKESKLLGKRQLIYRSCTLDGKTRSDLVNRNALTNNLVYKRNYLYNEILSM